MSLKNNLIFLFSILNFSAFAAAPNLPELLTKQLVNNIRYFSDDGTITYFQKSSGTLNVTHHYQTWELVKSGKETQYYVVVSDFKRKVLIEAYENYLTAHSFFKERTIYQADFLARKAEKIGEGMNPKLHLNDTWASFFNGKKREISLVKLGSGNPPVTIKLKHKVNPYFIPEVFMPNESTVALTDVGPSGQQILYRFDVLTGSFLQAYQTPSPGMKLELCSYKNRLYVGQFSIGDTANGSSIFSIEMDPGVTLKKMDLIYSSTQNDLGNMVCDISDDEVYFVKAMTKESELNTKITELAELKPSTKAIKVLTTFGDLTQLTKMDHRLLVPYRGKFYVAKGENNVKSDDLQKKESKDKPKVMEEAEDNIEVSE
jgi:hypothetical protein